MRVAGGDRDSARRTVYRLYLLFADASLACFELRDAGESLLDARDLVPL